jgi:hypothetical protein
MVTGSWDAMLAAMNPDSLHTVVLTRENWDVVATGLQTLAMHLDDGVTLGPRLQHLADEIDRQTLGGGHGFLHADRPQQ